MLRVECCAQREYEGFAWNRNDVLTRKVQHQTIIPAYTFQINAGQEYKPTSQSPQ